MEATKDTFRVLVVEDDLCLKTALSRCLQKMEIPSGNITWVGSGDEAVIRAAQESMVGTKEYDLVIVDIHLPGSLNGIQVINYFSEQRERPKILAISSSSPMEYLKMVPKTRYLPPFLKKPFRLTDFTGLLEDLIFSAPSGAATPMPRFGSKLH